MLTQDYRARKVTGMDTTTHHRSFTVGARVQIKSGSVTYRGAVRETRGTMFKDTAVLVYWENLDYEVWESPETLSLIIDRNDIRALAESNGWTLQSEPKGLASRDDTFTRGRYTVCILWTYGALDVATVWSRSGSEQASTFSADVAREWLTVGED